MGKKNDHKVQIWVAIIGLIGVIGAAVISNWEKLTSDKKLMQPNSTQISPPKTQNIIDKKISIKNQNAYLYYEEKNIDIAKRIKDKLTADGVTVNLRRYGTQWVKITENLIAYNNEKNHGNIPLKIKESISTFGDFKFHFEGKIDNSFHIYMGTKEDWGGSFIESAYIFYEAKDLEYARRVREELLKLKIPATLKSKEQGADVLTENLIYYPNNIHGERVAVQVKKEIMNIGGFVARPKNKDSNVNWLSIYIGTEQY